MAPENELAAFLRARRDQLRPADVGLPDSGRRRTPGLRREEVATLAGVSIDYLVRLEQGRDTNPSKSVLAALAHALRLDEDERLHLLKLATLSNSHELCPESAPTAWDIAPTVRTLIERLDPTPAFVTSPTNDVLVWNDAWATIVRPLGMLDGDPPNLARYTFANPAAHDTFADWSLAADEQVGRLRAANVFWDHDERLTDLVEQLTAYPEFDRRWKAHEVTEKRRGQKQLRHPTLGALALAYEVLLLEDGDQRLITWLPADDATAAALAELVAPSPVSPARLRVVGD
jgi:transcriptional regulator with XRE-family HTH domain